MIFNTVGRWYSSGNSILRGVPLFPLSYSSIQQELLKANLACCSFVLPTSTSDDILSPVVHCLNAPEPPAEANLTLRDYDPLSPRRRGGHLNYTCSAGGHNKFASDYTKRRYTLTCNDDNNYETPNWPTCVSSRCCRQILFKPCLFSATYCPEPETLETAEIRFYSSNSSITAGLDQIYFEMLFKF